MKPPVQLAPPPGPVLVIAPHPDDESCGIGGTVALHRLQGDSVHLCFVTDGTSGDPDAQFEDLARLRRDEARKAAEILGGCTCEFLGLPDGYEVTDSDLTAVAQLFDEVIDRVAPTLVYVPWSEEAHSDHAHSWQALQRCYAMRRAAGKSRPRVLEYEVWSPLPADFVVDVTSTAELKRLAMVAHASQVAYTDYPHQLLGLAAHRSVYLPKTSRYGEAFREGVLE
ncbi:MAG: PIG-L family deacetylase [Planctomycetes bacterium]|nr:PIG-L family deacetylase [Planctomycetota bacterium]MCB9918073.1 PIG-L family deacetylase [Planctomycetota bacterium]